MTNAAAIPIGPEDVAAAAGFVVIAIGIAAWHHTGEARVIAWAAFRALVQLSIMGFVLRALFDADHVGLSSAFIMLMVVFATQIAARRGVGIRHVERTAAIAIIGGSISVLLVMLLIGIIPPTARFMIPLAGMLVGNCMTTCGIALREVAREQSRSRVEIEAALMLGATSEEAAAQSRRRTMRAAMGPLIDATKAVGVVLLPGAMTGMILAGISPLKAVQLQIIVFFMLLGAASISVLLATWLSTRALFTDYAQLRQAPPAA